MMFPSFKEAKCITKHDVLEIAADQANMLPAAEAISYAQHVDTNITRILGTACGLALNYDEAEGCIFVDTCDAEVCPMDMLQED